MPQEPHIGVLPYKRRQRLFLFLLLIFVVALPLLIFYSSGNRIIFSDDSTSIVSMGGIYLSSGYETVSVFLNEEPVQDRRLFRQAFYIQSVPAGIHRLHVQQDGLQTWVKELPVYPYIVTEALSFTMPTEPQLRLIGPYLDEDDQTVMTSSSTIENLSGTTTNSFLVATDTPVSLYEINPEFEYLDELFSTTSRQTSSLLERYQQNLERFSFQSDVGTTTDPLATTTVRFQDMILYEETGEVFASWVGSESNVPYYFCVRYGGATTTAERYGAHVAEAVETMITKRDQSVQAGEWVCRDKIRIDRQQQDVEFFTFFPGSADLVLLQLEDGVYVSEIDDRAWQNSQLLYPGEGLEVLVDGGQIFIRDENTIFEVLTIIAE